MRIRAILEHGSYFDGTLLCRGTNLQGQVVFLLQNEQGQYHIAEGLNKVNGIDIPSKRIPPLTTEGRSTPVVG